MKMLKTITALMLVTFLLFNLTSCLVVHPASHNGNNGKHKGWYKSSGNPHNPVYKGPGKSHGKAHGHKK